jgi:hypothetical protein
MVKNFAESEANQVEGMIAFITNEGLLDDLLAERWGKFAAVYNGRSYASNQYDIKLENAANKWKFHIGSGVAVDPVKPPVVIDLPEPPLIDPVGSLSDYLTARNPNATPQDLATMKMFADTLEYIMGQRTRPPDIPQIELPNDPPSAGFSLPKPIVKGNDMTGIKGFFQSKTIKGAIVALFGSILPTVAPFFGFDFSPDDGQVVLENVSKLLEIVGILTAIWGRVVAKDEIRLGG